MSVPAQVAYIRALAKHVQNSATRVLAATDTPVTAQILGELATALRATADELEGQVRDLTKVSGESETER